MYCLELTNCDISNTSYYVEVEDGVLLRDDTRSWKMIPGGHGKSWKFLGKNVGTLYEFNTLIKSEVHVVVNNIYSEI